MCFKKKLREQKIAFCVYSICSVMESGFIKHDMFSDENIKVFGFSKAVELASNAFDTLKDRTKLLHYNQKGTLNAYDDRPLTQVNKVLLDLYEILMFGDYTSNANDETPDDLKHDLRIRITMLCSILNNYKPVIKQLNLNTKNINDMLGFNAFANI